MRRNNSDKVFPHLRCGNRVTTLSHEQHLRLALWRVNFLVFKTRGRRSDTTPLCSTHTPKKTLRCRRNSSCQTHSSYLSPSALQEIWSYLFSVQESIAVTRYTLPVWALGCDLISSHSTDYLASVHGVNCWHTKLGLSDCPSWISEKGSSLPQRRLPSLRVKDTARVIESTKPPKQSKVQAQSNTGEKCKWGILCSSRWAQ